MRHRLLLAVLLGLLALNGAAVFARAQTEPPGTGRPQALRKVVLHIGNASLNTQVAVTGIEQEIGLMYCKQLDDNDGMIFMLPFGKAKFWMKNTLIPLSVAFIDKNGVILEIHDMQPGDPNVPDSELPITASDSDQVAYALETNLRWFVLNGIKPGARLSPAPSTLTGVPK